MADAAIIGMGAVTSFGVGVDAFWNGLMEGKSGITAVETLGGNSRYVALVPDDIFAPLAVGAFRSRALSFAVTAVTEALLQATEYLGSTAEASFPPPAHRVGVCVGTTAGIRTEWDRTCGGSLNLFVDEDGLDELNGIAQAIASLFSFTGPCITVNTACSSSTSACAIAIEWLRSNEVDVTIVCGADEFTEYSAVGFELMGSYAALPTSPFGRSDGLTLGEGAGAFVLCRAESISQHTPKPPFIDGYGLSADAFHPSAPDPDGQGQKFAMERALLGAGIKKSQIALINLHGTGTPLNDTAEARIFDDYFDDPAVKPLATANKGAIGHTLGAAGVLETIATIRALQDACVPQTIGNDQKESADVGLASHLVLGTPRTLERQGVGLNVNAAFGGHNSCIVVSLDHQEVEEVPTETVGVCIDRVGIAGANGDDVTRWRAIADGGGRAEANFGPSEVERPDFVPRSDWRTFDRLTQLTVLTSAQVTSYIPPDERDNVAFLFATERGPSDAVDELLARTRAGKRLNPMLFGRLAFTHCAGAVTQQLELRGPTMTFTAGRLGGLAALQYGLCLIRRGICDRAVVVATDTVSDHVRASPKYVRKPIDGARLAECSIAFLLTRSPASGTGVVRTVCLGRSEPAPLWHGPCDPLTWLRLIDTALGRSSMNADSVGTYAIASATERGSSDAVNIAVKARSRAGAMILDPSAAFGDVGAASSFLPYVIDRVVEPMKAVVEPLLICQHDASGLLGVALIE